MDMVKFVIFSDFWGPQSNDGSRYKKSFEYVHWITTVYWISIDSSLNSTTVITLLYVYFSVINTWIMPWRLMYALSICGNYLSSNHRLSFYRQMFFVHNSFDFVPNKTILIFALEWSKYDFLINQKNCCILQERLRIRMLFKQYFFCPGNGFLP